MDGARFLIERILKPRFLSQTSSYDVASTIHQSLPAYAGVCLVVHAPGGAFSRRYVAAQVQLSGKS